MTDEIEDEVFPPTPQDRLIETFDALGIPWYSSSGDDVTVASPDSKVREISLTGESLLCAFWFHPETGEFSEALLMDVNAPDPTSS